MSKAIHIALPPEKLLNFRRLEKILFPLAHMTKEYMSVSSDEEASDQHVYASILNTLVIKEHVDVALYPAETVSYPLPEELDILALTKPLSNAENASGHPLHGQFVIVGKQGRYDLREIFNAVDIRSQYGKVFLVGGGPGDPELLTLKASKLIRQADIIFHDHLLNASILESTQAELVFAGKKSKHHFRKQEDTNEQIYQAAKAGKKVVRLKGGDPYIFGRGGEELDYLQQRMIEVEVIPGITAATGASAYTAIPLTYRNISGSVAFLTGYPIEKVSFPEVDTLVYYMGASNIDYISHELIKRGRKPSTPVAIVRNATYPNQQTTFTRLGDLAAKKVLAESPAVAIIGEVVKNRNHSLLTKPLVLVTGANAEKYHHLGHVVHKPLIDLMPVDTHEFEGDWLNEPYEYVIFTSRYTVDYFFQNLYKIQQDARWFAGIKVISIGRVTSAALEAKGIVPDTQIWPESSTGIIKWLRKHAKKRKKILLPRSDKSSSYLLKELNCEGYSVHSPIVYKNTMPVNAESIDLQPIDIIVFTSPSTVENFLKLYGEIPKHVKIVARGEQTTKLLQSCHIDKAQWLDSNFMKKDMNKQTMEQSDLKP